MPDYFSMREAVDGVQVADLDRLRAELLNPDSLPAVGEAGGAETIPLAPSAEPTGTTFLGGRL
jgi:hypothetical protein